MAEMAAGSSVRDGAKRVQVFNSGLEVWLYDDGNLGAIRGPAGVDYAADEDHPRFAELMRQGLLAGYDLYQDDGIDVEVLVGAPLSASELAVSRWLEPQTTFLRLPSGRLCIESTDASRLGPEDPMDEGAVVEAPPGDYRVTLYRIDHEALEREGLEWDGPQEIIVLTPDGACAEAAAHLLPFQPRRDLDWVGNYRIDGDRVEALAWFDDYWDSFVLNLDAAAAAKLALAPGMFIRTRVPAAELTLVSEFTKSMRHPKRVPPPKDMALDEYGYAALGPLGDWNGAEALYCRRERSKKAVDSRHRRLWLPAVVEVLRPRTEAEAPAAAPGKTRFTLVELASKEYFDPGFLGLILSDVFPEAGDADELSLAEALAMADAEFGNIGLAPRADLAWEWQGRPLSPETGCRLYTGLPDCFGLILAGEGMFELLLLSEFDGGDWIATGLAEECGQRVEGRDNIRLQAMDEEFARIAEAHRASLREAGRAPAAAPADAEQARAAFERFVAAAFD
ncbi:MAG TPA: hypothetical protein VEC06_12860 [Paucimonas sp.]|nr:hypothetical protein [Paucimonas sp.]